MVCVGRSFHARLPPKKMTNVFIDSSYSKFMQVASIATMFWSEVLHFEFVICRASRTLNSLPWTICSSSVLVRHSSLSLSSFSVWHLASGIWHDDLCRSNKISGVHTHIFPSLFDKRVQKGSFQDETFQLRKRAKTCFLRNECKTRSPCGPHRTTS